MKNTLTFENHAIIVFYNGGRETLSGLAIHEKIYDEFSDWFEMVIGYRFDRTNGRRDGWGHVFHSVPIGDEDIVAIELRFDRDPPPLRKSIAPEYIVC